MPVKNRSYSQTDSILPRQKSSDPVPAGCSGPLLDWRDDAPDTWPRCVACNARIEIGHYYRVYMTDPPLSVPKITCANQVKCRERQLVPVSPFRPTSVRNSVRTSVSTVGLPVAVEGLGWKIDLASL